MGMATLWEILRNIQKYNEVQRNAKIYEERHIIVDLKAEKEKEGGEEEEEKDEEWR